MSIIYSMGKIYKLNKTKLHREDHSVQIIIVAIILVIMIIGISEGMRTGSTTRKTDNRLPDHYLYYYDHMTDNQKEVYEILYMNYANLMDIPITETSDYELICDVWTYVKRDCPELYYVDALQSLRFTVGAKTIRKVGYTLYVPKEEQSAADERISQFVKGCQANISNTMTDYEKVELIIKYMCANITYQKDAPYDQCIYSAALGKCVCAGYSNMFKCLCDINNIPCVAVSGQLAVSITHGIVHI